MNTRNALNDLLLVLLMVYVSSGGTREGTPDEPPSSEASAESPRPPAAAIEVRPREQAPAAEVDDGLAPRRLDAVLHADGSLEAGGLRLADAGGLARLASTQNASTVRLAVEGDVPYQVLRPVARAVASSGLALEIQ